ncbi:MAG: YbaB/EbfC family nucleoid-associated protein [Caulobacter sp.]|jgi:DNA-binding YbaB/EbfC family protein|nr:YbaB/EbfC family nucleoid-associated protein [Caulobacter sp.]
MKDIGGLMKQAQAMQQKLAEAQEKVASLEVEGTSGGGMVRVVLKGTGELKLVEMDDGLMVPGEGDVLSDLLVAAHSVARQKLEAQTADLMKAAAGPLAGLKIPGMPF